jgi:hypothetical protein
MKTFSKPIPRYVGITDFRTREEAEKMQLALEGSTWGMKNPPVLMVGLMISFKTLWGIESKWTPIFPIKERLDEIFPDYDAWTLNTIHYADFVDHGVWGPEYSLFHSLAKAIDYARNNLHAIQLDMTWPDPGEIAGAIHASRHAIQVVLQIGRKALNVAGHNPKIVARMLEDYTEVIDGVLLDQSMGEARLMDSELLISYLEEIQKAHPQLHLAVAGGLRHNTLSVLVPLLERFPNLSIDAQAGLHEDNNAMLPVSLRAQEAYLEEAGALFKQYER